MNIRQCCGSTEGTVLSSPSQYQSLFGGIMLWALLILIYFYSIPWHSCESVKEAYKLIQQWPLLDEPSEALGVFILHP
jgi:hypothetical protein